MGLLQAVKPPASRERYDSIHKESFLDKINRNTLEHDVLLNDIRFKLERIGVASSWVSEQTLRRNAPKREYHSWGEINPDGIFASQTPDGLQAVALELELSGKNPARYAKIFSHYGSLQKFWGLWYVVADKALGKRISHFWRQANPEVVRPKFGWVLAEDVLNAEHEIKIKTLTGSLLLNFNAS